MKSSTLSAGFLTALLAGEAGGRCTYDGIVGTCVPTSDCGRGFTVTGYCPNDPADVKCCLGKPCTDTAGSSGTCLDTSTGCSSGTFVTNRCPGPSDVQCCVGGSPSSDDDEGDELEVVFWINSFIPKDIPGISKPLPHTLDQTMIVGLTEVLEDVLALGGCFGTDQRTYSSDQHASARMHSEAMIRISAATGCTYTQAHHINLTHKVDCDDGHLKDTKTAGTDDMAFGLIVGSPSKVVMSYVGSAGNPFDAFAPRIDMKGTLTVDRVGGTVTFDGAVDDFPACEASAMLDGFGPYRVAVLGPAWGKGASSLRGGAERAFGGTIYV